jgi:hypothetical protein
VNQQLQLIEQIVAQEGIESMSGYR